MAPASRAVTLTWVASTDVASVTVQRRPLTRNGKSRAVYKGKARSFTDRGLRNGLRYRYSVAAVDAAGNAATARATAMPRALIAPAQGATLRRGRPPTLSWFAAPKASYYNVQLYRGRTKVLSAWPVATKLKLAGSWRYAGQTFTFGPGQYRWYVFPGLGDRAANRYGALLGSSAFVVR